MLSNEDTVVEQRNENETRRVQQLWAEQVEAGFDMADVSLAHWG